MNFAAKASPIGVSFQWERVGGGEILNPNDRVVQYEEPLSVTLKEDVTLSVTVTDPQTGCSAVADIGIQLLPSPTDTPPPLPTNTLTPSPTPDSAPTPTSTLVVKPSLPSSNVTALQSGPAPTSMADAVRIDQPPTIDGRLDDAAWSQAQPLMYATHPPANDSTTFEVKLLWDDKYLYAAFDVNDTQVEDSSLENVYDGDSVGVIIENGGQNVEYRYTILGDTNERSRLIGDRASTKALSEAGLNEAISEASLKDATTLNDPNDQDQGYTVELRIPWEKQVTEGSLIPADFWSLDHDYNPGKPYNHPDTAFSKISWDGDQNVTTARKSILLQSISSPAGAPLVFVSNLQDGATVAQRLSLVGEYAPEVNDDIWVLVGLVDDRLYPQSIDACNGKAALKLGGRWEVPIGIGNANDANRIFEVIVVTADSSAGQFLAQTVQTWCRQGEYPGLLRNELPAGLTEHQRIKVTRSSEFIGPPPPISNIELAGQVSITSLSAGDVVTQSFGLNGQAGPEVTAPIWLLVYNPNGRFYPQSSRACDNKHTVRSDNLWQVPVWLGGWEDAGKPFDIIAILADPEANSFFEVTQQAWCQADSYPGFLAIELPQGLDEKDSVRVIRQ